MAIAAGLQIGDKVRFRRWLCDEGDNATPYPSRWINGEVRGFSKHGKPWIVYLDSVCPDHYSAEYAGLAHDVELIGKVI